MKQLQQVRANILLVKNSEGEFMPVSELVILQSSYDYQVTEDFKVAQKHKIEETRFLANYEELAMMVGDLTAIMDELRALKETKQQTKQ